MQDPLRSRGQYAILACLAGCGIDSDETAIIPAIKPSHFVHS